MNRQNYKKKFIILAVLVMSLFWIRPTLAVVDGLEVEFQDIPLFNEANFLPGDSIARWVKVTNNTGQTERIVAEAINVNDPDGFGNGLTLEIKRGGTHIYNGSLSQFFNAGEVFLSDLAGNGTQTQYDFIITFYSGANNTFQGKSLGFDILVGFQGIGGGLAPGAGSGGGGFLPSGLSILEPLSTGSLTSDSITIYWDTSYASTSQIVYAAKNETYEFDLTKPNYGYPHASLEDLTKVTSHSVTLTGLSSGMTYYYRCISHGSFAVSTEYSFTTLNREEELIYSETLLDKGSVLAEELASNPEELGFNITEQEGEEKKENSGNLLSSVVEYNKEIKAGLIQRLSAAVGIIFSLQNVLWLLLILIIVTIALFVLLKKKGKIS